MDSKAKYLADDCSAVGGAQPAVVIPPADEVVLPSSDLDFEVKHLVTVHQM